MRTPLIHPTGFAINFRIIQDTAVTAGRNKIMGMGPLFYLMVWSSLPLFLLMSVALIYRQDDDLRNYALVGGIGVSLLFSMLFGAGEILDSERQRGTLGNLFVSPAPRYAWLAGFQVFNLAEAAFAGSVALGIGSLLFGVHLDIAPLSLIVSLILFVAALWGFSMIAGAVGVAIRNANQLSNLLFTPILMVAGTMYPVDRMPHWLQIPARCLPFSYGMEALVASLTTGAPLSSLWHDFLPLIGFAIVLPVLGMFAFNRLERMSKHTGSLELMS